MTSHAVRIKASTEQASTPSTVRDSSPPDLVSVLPDKIKRNVFDKIDEVMPEQAQSARVTNTSIDGSGTDHIRALYRADGAAAKKDLLDKVEQNAVPNAKWYRIEYHECDHDEPASDRTGCSSWQTEREKGRVPSDV